MILETKLGKLYGEAVGKSDYGKDVCEIHSVPYALCKRFEKPQRILSHPVDEIINKKETLCFPQRRYSLWINYFLKHHMMRPEFLPIKDTQSEEAFVINIWTDDFDDKKPVTVFIHGGGEGSGTVPIYTGGNLAKKGVVAVTVTYRIGSFGYSPVFYKDGMRANLAYFDQQAALLWIRDNIEHFGGDPKNITLIGHCGGGLAALYHFLNPVSNKCFDKLMLLCGNLPTLSLKEEAKEDYFKSLKKIGAGSDCDLKNMSVKKLIKRNALAMNDVLDYDFFKDEPEKLLERGDFPKIPVLIGTNSDEFSMIEFPMYYKFLGIATKEKYVDGALFKKYGKYGKILKNELKNESAGVIDLQIKIMELLIFHVSALKLMETISKKCPVYGYRLHYVPNLYKGIRGSYHGAELVYFFNNFDKMNILQSYKNRRQVDILQNDWLDFIKTGNIKDRELFNKREMITDYDKEVKTAAFPHKSLIHKLEESGLIDEVRRSYIKNMTTPTENV